MQRRSHVRHAVEHHADVVVVVGHESIVSISDVLAIISVLCNRNTIKNQILLSETSSRLLTIVIFMDDEFSVRVYFILRPERRVGNVKLAELMLLRIVVGARILRADLVTKSFAPRSPLLLVIAFDLARQSSWEIAIVRIRDSFSSW